MCHKFKRSCQWAVIGGFRSILFAKHVERWMAKDIRYAGNTKSGYKYLGSKGFFWIRSRWIPGSRDRP